MPFVVGLLQTTLTMTDCTHRLASLGLRRTLLALPFPSVLRFHRVLYVRVTITSLLKNTCLDVRTSAVFGEKLNPARPLEGSKFAAASSLQTAAEYEVSA